MKRLLQFAVFGLAAACAAGAFAQNSPPRGGKWEFTLEPQFIHSQSFDSGNGSGGTVDSTLGFGFGVAYNLNNHLSLGGDFTWTNANYNSTTAGAGSGAGTSFTSNGTLYANTIRFNATWNILNGDFTPFVVGGIGSTYIDTNIPNGPPSNQCWYDPWWGYYCGIYVPTKTAYYVSYSGGLGVRFDLDRSIFLRASVLRQWLDVGRSIGQPYTDAYRIDVGFKF